MVEKLLVGFAGTLCTALIAVAGWNAIREVSAAAWSWRSAITVHMAWGY